MAIHALYYSQEKFYLDLFIHILSIFYICFLLIINLNPMLNFLLFIYFVTKFNESC